MTLPSLQHLPACHRAKDCPACKAVAETLSRLEETCCTCPAGTRRSGLFSHLAGCPSEPVDTLRIRLAGYGSLTPDSAIAESK